MGSIRCGVFFTLWARPYQAGAACQFCQLATLTLNPSLTMRKPFTLQQLDGIELNHMSSPLRRLVGFATLRGE